LKTFSNNTFFSAKIEGVRPETKILVGGGVRWEAHDF